MLKILVSEDNQNIKNDGSNYIYQDVITKQKERRALLGRSAGSECGNSCSCS